MKKDIETFLEVKTRERAMLLDGRVEEDEEEGENFPLVEDNDEEAEEKDEDDEDAPNELTSSASTFSTPGKDSDYTQYSPDSPLPAQHQMKYSFTPKQNSVEEHGAFTPGGSMKTSPRISALIEKAAKSPLRANVGNGIVLDGIGMEDGEEGRRNVQQQQQQQQQDLLLSPWLMTFEDTPPEKKQNLIDLKTPPAPREESYESVRLQAEFIKMQQNAAALERKKQSRSSGKPKKVNNSDDAEDQKEQELFALREKLETQERRLRQLEAVTAKSASSLTVPKQHRSRQQQQQQQQRATTTTKINRENEEKKIEARVRLLQALRMRRMK